MPLMSIRGTELGPVAVPVASGTYSHTHTHTHTRILENLYLYTLVPGVPNSDELGPGGLD
jgi:hypothetical protein